VFLSVCEVVGRSACQNNPTAGVTVVDPLYGMPGLIHMLDALFASLVVLLLNRDGVRDVVAVHDAFLVPQSAWRELVEAVHGAGAAWLPTLRPFYDVFERYLPTTSPEAEIARQWRARWEQRVQDCLAGRDTWPIFLTKPEGTQYR
jgi:hypothetical protein